MYYINRRVRAIPTYRVYRLYDSNQVCYHSHHHYHSTTDSNCLAAALLMVDRNLPPLKISGKNTAPLITDSYSFNIIILGIHEDSWAQKRFGTSYGNSSTGSLCTPVLCSAL